MRILIECPKCRSRQKLSKTTCTGKFRYGAQRGKLCGYQLKKIRIPIYWIDYDVPANLDGSGGHLKKMALDALPSVTEGEKELEPVEKQRNIGCER